MFKSARCLPKRRFGIIMMVGINMRFIFFPKNSLWHIFIFKLLRWYNSCLARYDTLLVRYGTLFARRCTLLSRYESYIYTVSIRLFWCSSACQGLYHSFIISNRIDLFWIKLLNKRIKKTFCGCIFSQTSCTVLIYKDFFLIFYA